jgi:hypothetical protein
MTFSAKDGIEDKLWIHIFNLNEKAYCFSQGEGYYFSSKDKVFYRYADVDKKMKKEKILSLDGLDAPDSVGSYKIINKERLTIVNKTEDIFSIQFRKDTIMWGWQFAQLTLQRPGSKEKYTFYHQRNGRGIDKK